jgi:8-oxo-dGTP pyrophosphatase MutT (NUDIX family)
MARVLARRRLAAPSSGIEHSAMSEELDPWEVLDSDVLIERWWMKLRVDRVRLPNGETIPEFHVVEYPHWVLVVAQDEEGRLLFVEQYRHGVATVSLEFPAGMMEEGEDPEETAGRELLEETGWKAELLRPIGAWAADPSRQSDRVFAFAAPNVHHVDSPSPDATEQLVVRRLTLEETEDAITNGRLVHGLHVAAFYRALRLGLISERSGNR